MSPNPRAVREPILLGSRGPDREALQASINERLGNRRLDWLQLEVDGVAGPATFAAADRLAFAMGIYGPPIQKLRDGRASLYAQRLLRGLAARSPQMKTLDLARRPKVKLWRLDRGPRIVSLGRATSAVFGSLGDFYATSGHYTAGPVPKTDADCLALFRAYHEYHRGLGWGGLSYTYVLAPSGTLILGRPTSQKGAHVLGNNTGNVGVVVPGTTGDRATANQQRTLQWLCENGHTSRMPASHRLPKKLTAAPVVLRPHQDWPGNATGCPGDFRPLYESRGSRA